MTDTASANTNTSASISVNQRITGTIDTRGDEDWFRVSLNAGRTYQIDLEGDSTDAGTLPDPMIEGIWITNRRAAGGTADDDGGEGLNSRVRFTPETSGNYYIAASGFGNDTGTFSLQVLDLSTGDDYEASTETSGRLTLDLASEGAIERPGDEDWYSVSLQRGSLYRVVVEGVSTPGSGVLTNSQAAGIYDSAGSLVAGASADGTLDFVPLATGEYFVAAGALGNDIGSYSLVVEDISGPDDFGSTVEQAGSIVVGGSVAGQIESENDQDWFGVVLQAGQTYQVDLEGIDTERGTLSNPVIRGVYDSAGDLILFTANDDSGEGLNARFLFTPKTSGTFYVAAGGQDNETGTYSLSFSQEGADDDFGETAGSSGSVAVGSSAIGRIESVGDLDRFAVSLVAGREYRIDLEGSPTNAGTLDDPLLFGIYGSAGALISKTRDEDSGQGLNSSLTFSPNSSGTYYVTAGSEQFRTGSYSVGVTDLGLAADLNPVLAPAQGYSGSHFIYRDNKPLLLGTGSQVQALQGSITSVNSSELVLEESDSSLLRLARLSGDIQNNNPQTLAEAGGTVTSIAFLGSLAGEPLTSLSFSSGRSVQTVLNNWQGGFLAESNIIDVDSLLRTNDEVRAGNGNDIIDLGAGDDILDGEGGNDVLYAGPGFDTLIGGPGLDTAVFSGARQQYSLVNAGDIMRASGVIDDNDSLSGIERLAFEDQSLAFDFDGNAGMLAKMIGALIGPSGLSQRTLIGEGLHILDGATYSFEAAMALGIDAVLGANPGNAALVELLYTNTTGAAPSAAVLSQNVAALSNGNKTQAGLAVEIAQGDQNLTNIDFVGLEQSGLAYLDFS